MFALTETTDASPVNGLDISDVIVILTSILAFVLGIISLVGYRRDGRIKILFVAAAFFIFTLKGVMIIGSDLLSLQKPTLDLLAQLLDFAVLIFFFAGMIKR